MKNVIDMNKNKLTGQYEIYTSTVEDYFTNNNIEQISIEEMTIDIDTCMQNFDKFYGIINSVSNEGYITNSLGLEAVALCKSLNINLNKKFNIKKKYSISNEEINIGIVALIAAAVVAIAAIFKKIWNLITGSGSNSDTAGSNNTESKVNIIKTSSEVQKEIKEYMAKMSPEITKVSQSATSIAASMNNFDKEFTNIFEYFDNRYPSLLESVNNNISPLSKKILFSDLDDSFYSNVESLINVTLNASKLMGPVMSKTYDNIDIIYNVFPLIEKLKEGDTVEITNINNIITSAINDVKSFSITEADIEKVNAATDEFKEIDYFNDITPPSENITSVVIFNYYNSPSIQRINRVSETYSELIGTLSKEKLHEFPKRLESFGKDIVEIEGLFKDLNNEAFKQNQEINNNLQEYFQLIKDVLKNLSLISTTVIKCIKLTETLIDSQYTLSNIICEQSDIILKIFLDISKKFKTAVAKEKDNSVLDDKIKVYLDQVESLRKLIEDRNKKFEGIMGDTSQYKDIKDADTFKKFITRIFRKNTGAPNNVSNEQYDVASIEYLPSNEDYTTSQIRHNVNHYNVFDLNSIKVNKMHLGINTTALEEFIKDINLDNEIGIENNAALESFYKELDIDSISVEQYLDKADKLFDLNNRIISSGAITKEIGLEAISICNDLNINVNKLSLYPSKIGYSVSLEAVGVGIFAMIVAAIAAVVYIAKKVWSAIMGEGSSGSGGDGGGFDTDDVAVEKKITAIETTQEVSQQIVENKVIVEDKIEDVSVALKETISSPEVKEVVKEIEKKKELSPLVKYVLSTNYSNIFDLLDKLPETDIAYGPLVSVVNQLRNLKSFEKEIVLNQVSSDFSNKALAIIHELLIILPNMVEIAKSTGHEYEKMSTILDTIVQKNMTAKDAAQYFKTEYKEDNPSVINDDHVTSFGYDYGVIKDYLSNTNLDNEELSIASLYACKADPDGYSEFIKKLSDMLTKINEHKLFNQLEIGEKTIKYFDEHIDKINSPVLTENDEFKNVFINAAKGHMATFNVIKQYIIIYGKVTLTLEKIIESKLKIDLIIEAYLKAATGQLVELKKRLKSDFSSIDKEHDSDALQKRLSVFYDQIDDLVELSNGCSKDILDIISKDPNYKDIKNSDETFNRFLLRMTNVSKVTTGAVATGNEKYEIMLRPRYDILTYSNEAYNAPFIGLIATGLIIFLSVIGAILKKIFGINKGNSSDSKNTEKNITSSSKALTVLSNNTSHAIEFSHFDFNISNLDISTIKKPATMEDKEYEIISQIATEFKKYGDNKIFEFFEYATGYNNEKLTPIAEKIKDKINNLNGLSNSLLSGKLAKTWDEYKKTKEIGITEVSRLVTNIEQLNDITKLLEKDSLTGDDLTAEIKSLVAKQEELANITEMLTSTNTSVVDMVNSDDENSYTLSTFLPTMEKLIQDKTLSNSIITTYGSTSVLVSNIQQFVDKIEKEKEKISNFNPNVNDIPKEITNQFKEAYQAYIKSTVNLQTALFTLSANIQRILKEYKNIYQMFFTISFDMLRIVFVTLADLKKCNINTATQHQLLHKTVKDFLKVAKDTLDEIEGPLRFDQESTYYVMAKPDIDIWKKITGGFDKLERDLFNITNKMVR